MRSLRRYRGAGAAAPRVADFIVLSTRPVLLTRACPALVDAHGQSLAPESFMKVHRRAAFTLIEILVVVAIIALLVAILLPSLGRARAQARMIVCQSNIKQILYAFQMYTVSN